MKLLTKSDMATRWDVSRQVVHNWEHRHDDFPKEYMRVDNERLPLYKLDDIQKYEEERGIDMYNNLSREQAIKMASEYLEEDVTQSFEEEDERSSINGTPFFYPSNSNNAAVRIDVNLSEDEIDVLYNVVTVNIFDVK